MSGRGRGRGRGLGSEPGRGRGRGRGRGSKPESVPESGPESGPGIKDAALRSRLNKLMVTCMKTKNYEIIGECAEILQYMDDKSEQVDKLVKVIQDMIGNESSVNCINLWYEIEYVY